MGWSCMENGYRALKRQMGPVQLALGIEVQDGRARWIGLYHVWIRSSVGLGSDLRCVFSLPGSEHTVWHLVGDADHDLVKN